MFFPGCVLFLVSLLLFPLYKTKKKKIALKMQLPLLIQSRNTLAKCIGRATCGAESPVVHDGKGIGKRTSKELTLITNLYMPDIKKFFWIFNFIPPIYVSNPFAGAILS